MNIGGKGSRRFGVLNEMKREVESYSHPTVELQAVDKAVQKIADSLRESPNWFEYYCRNHRVRISFDLAQIKQLFDKDDRVLEVGASPLLLTVAAKEEGVTLTGLDIKPDRFAEAATKFGLEIVHCDIEKECLPFETDYFDGIIINEVFEHLRIDVIHTFKELNRVLKLGGTITLSTPNGASYDSLRNLLIHNRGLDTGIYENFEKIHDIGHMGHIREYTATDVIDFLSRMGFTCTKIVYRGRFSSNIGQVLARLLPSLRPFFTIVATKS